MRLLPLAGAHLLLTYEHNPRAWKAEIAAELAGVPLPTAGWARGAGKQSPSRDPSCLQVPLVNDSLHEFYTCCAVVCR